MSEDRGVHPLAKPWLAHYEEGVPQTIETPRLTLPQMLESSCRAYAGKPALSLILRHLGPITVGGGLTYQQLGDQVNRCAAALASLGVRRGDRVALMLPNLPQFIITFYGALKLGAVVVNTNPTYTAREMQQQFADSGAETVVLLSPTVARLREVQAHTPIKRVLITDIDDYVSPPFGPLVRRTLRRQGLLVDVPERPGEGVHRFRALLEAHPGAPPPAPVQPEDVALLQYTGGTTGVPKGAMLSHANLIVNALQMRVWMPSLEEGKERFMAALPFFHVYGMTTTMGLGIYLGAELILLPSPRPIDGVMKAIDRRKATIFPGVPTMYVGIINHPELSRYDLRSVKACVCGAASLPLEVQERFGQLTGGRLVEGYGLTEASPVTHCNPVYGERRAGSIGLPLPDVEARIVDADTLAEQPVGESGELWVRGPQVMRGYWNKPDETAVTLTQDGWLRTGDIARMDEDGYFYIIDRLKDIIIASGLKIVPREVEEVLYEHPKVQEAVVAGVPDPYRGETVKAYIVLKAGETATAEEIQAFCAGKLATFKLPRQIEFRSELPKSIIGKLLRRALVEEEVRKSSNA
jgi:long-chain acyl-CoA synthetase